MKKRRAMSYTLEKLIQEVETIGQFVNTELKGLAPEKLKQRPASGGWNLLECLEHLNRYTAFYLPELEKAMQKYPRENGLPEIKLSWLGRRSVELVAPENAKKQQTLKRLDPEKTDLEITVVGEFLAYQQQLRTLLRSAEKADLAKKAIPVEFFRLLKLNIGETLLFLVVHEQRHLLQLKRILAAIAPDRQAAA